MISEKKHASVVKLTIIIVHYFAQVAYNLLFHLGIMCPLFLKYKSRLVLKIKRF